MWSQSKHHCCHEFKKNFWSALLCSCFVCIADRFLTRFRPNVFKIEIQIPGRMDSSTNCLYFTAVRRVKKEKKNYLLNIAQIKVSSIFKSSFMQRNKMIFAHKLIFTFSFIEIKSFIIIFVFFLYTFYSN